MIDQSTVYKCLEKKTLIMGFELPDLFILSIALCFLNLIFATAEMKLLLTWGPTLALALLFRLMKNGKADNYLLHWLRYHLSPGIMVAFSLAKENQLLKIKRRKMKYARFKFE